MTRFTDKTALITGGTSGTGLAERLTPRGRCVPPAGRRIPADPLALFDSSPPRSRSHFVRTAERRSDISGPGMPASEPRGLYRAGERVALGMVDVRSAPLVAEQLARHVAILYR